MIRFKAYLNAKVSEGMFSDERCAEVVDAVGNRVQTLCDKTRVDGQRVIVDVMDVDPDKGVALVSLPGESFGHANVIVGCDALERMVDA